MRKRAPNWRTAGPSPSRSSTAGLERADDAAQLVDGSLGNAANVGQARAQFLGSIVLQHLETQAQKQQGLAGFIVQLAANAAALRLLRRASLHLKQAHGRRVPGTLDSLHAAGCHGFEERQFPRQPGIGDGERQLDDSHCGEGVRPEAGVMPAHGGIDHQGSSRDPRSI